MNGKLYLVPNSLGNEDNNIFLAPWVSRLIPELKHLIVEDVRNARRYLKRIDRDIDIDSITFYLLNKHTPTDEISSFLQPLMKGMDVGIISEAGLPGIADPGASVVRLAHQKNFKVIPLTGPSSIFMALMASGLNGQSFRFCGYLPVKSNERIQALKRLEKKAVDENETQIFIETPYRNNAIVEDILRACHNQTMLTIAVDITLPEEFIITRTVNEWKKKKPDLHKRPAVFLMGR